jgi:hypothetical protein
MGQGSNGKNKGRNQWRWFPVEEVTDGEEDADRWGPPVSVKRKRKRKEKERKSERGVRAEAGWAVVLLGPGRGPVGLSFPFFLFFLLFFSVSPFI